MEQPRNVLVLSAVRTAIGKYGGGLAAVPPCDLAATVVREAVTLERRRPGVPAGNGAGYSYRASSPEGSAGGTW